MKTFNTSDLLKTSCPILDQRRSASILKKIISSSRKELSAKVSDVAYDFTLENSRRYNYRRSPKDHLHKRQRMGIELHCLIELLTTSKFTDELKQSYGVQSVQVIQCEPPTSLTRNAKAYIAYGLIGTCRSDHWD